MVSSLDTCASVSKAEDCAEYKLLFILDNLSIYVAFKVAIARVALITLFLEAKYLFSWEINLAFASCCLAFFSSTSFTAFKPSFWRFKALSYCVLAILFFTLTASKSILKLRIHL